MNSLLWKQWRENRRYLAIFTAWMTLAVCYTVGYELGHHYRAVVGSFSGSALFYGFIAAIILAMRASCGEHTDGTTQFTAALPISPRRVAAIQITAAVGTFAVPIIFAACVLSISLASGLVEQAEPRVDRYIQLPNRDSASLLLSLEQLWSVATIAIVGGAQMLLVLSVAGCWLRSQSQVGLLGAVLALGSVIASGVFWIGERNPYAQLVYGVLLPRSLVIHWGYGEQTGGYTDHELANYRWIALALATVFLAIIGRLFVTQYGKLRAPFKRWSLRRFLLLRPAILSHIPMRLPGRVAAMIWIELRQAVPLAVFGLMLAALVTIASVSMEGSNGGSFSTSVLTQLPHSTFFVGALWAVVVGSALYSADFDSGIGSFWRSRPIPPGLWFWTKFTVGLAAVLVVLDGVTIAISWTAPRESMTTGMSWAYVGCFPIIHALMYTLAVFGTCWLRRPAIGGIVAVLSYTVLTNAITAFTTTHHLQPIDVYNSLLSAERSGELDFSQHGYPLVYSVLTATIVAFAILSSRLARPLQPTSRWFRPLPT